MNREEIEFRKRLRAFLLGAWLPSWHEPTMGSSVGVPDCSFIMQTKYADCETGWAELKIVRQGSVHIESTQHQWIGVRKGLIPIFFFIEVEKTEIVLVSGAHHLSIHEKPIEIVRDLAEGREYKYATCRNRMVADLIELTKR